MHSPDRRWPTDWDTWCPLEGSTRPVRSHYNSIPHGAVISALLEPCLTLTSLTVASQTCVHYGYQRQSRSCKPRKELTAWRGSLPNWYPGLDTVVPHHWQKPPRRPINGTTPPEPVSRRVQHKGVIWSLSKRWPDQFRVSWQSLKIAVSALSHFLLNVGPCGWPLLTHNQ